MGNPADKILAVATAFAIILFAYRGVRAFGRWVDRRNEEDWERCNRRERDQ